MQHPPSSELVGSHALRTSRPSVPLAAAAALALLFAGRSAQAQCEGWSTRFGPPGVFAAASSLAWHDDGSGPALYVGGPAVAGDLSVNGVARWNGSRWSAVGAGLHGSVQQLLSFDDGNGNALFARTTTPEPGARSAVNRWDGSSWSPVGVLRGQLLTMEVLREASGAAALYAGGRFDMPRCEVARWDGTSWQALPAAGLSPVRWVTSLAMFDDGSGPAIYAATSTAGYPTSSPTIARWRNGLWTAVAGSPNGPVTDLVVLDDGGGPALYAVGPFTTTSLDTNGVARFDGSSWSRLGEGLLGQPLVATVVRRAGAEALLVGGSLWSILDPPGPQVRCGAFALWDGIAWSSAAPEDATTLTDVPRVAALAGLPDGRIAAAGSFDTIGGVRAANVALWNGRTWAPPSAARSEGVAHVSALAAFDAGAGPELVLFSRSGTFDSEVFAWDGARTRLLRYPRSPGAVLTAGTFDLGGGARVYAGGDFEELAGQPAGRIVSWDGQAWSALGAGMSSGRVLSIAAVTHASGRLLYVGGAFDDAGGQPAASIASWNGVSWAALGSGVQPHPSPPPPIPPAHAVVSALASFGPPGNESLYVGGSFGSAGNLAATENIARWDGGAWHALGPVGAAGSVGDLVVADLGQGPVLVAGGSFQSIGGTAARFVAAWNGSGWSAVGSPTGPVQDLVLFDDGTGAGPRLYASSGEVWTGTSWAPFGGGPNGSAASFWNAWRDALAFDDGSGPALFVGGSFAETETDVPSYGLAKWRSTFGPGCANQAGTVTCPGDGSGTPCPCSNSGAAGHGCAHAQDADGAYLYATGDPTSAQLVLHARGLAPHTTAILLRATPGFAAVPFGDGLDCLGPSAVVVGVGPSVLGQLSLAYAHASGPGAFLFQARFRSPPASFCDPASAVASTNAFSVFFP